MGGFIWIKLSSYRNKHSKLSDRFRELFKKNGTGKLKKGPHPEEMHQRIYKIDIESD